MTVRGGGGGTPLTLGLIAATAQSFQHTTTLASSAAVVASAAQIFILGAGALTKTVFGGLNASAQIFKSATAVLAGNAATVANGSVVHNATAWQATAVLAAGGAASGGDFYGILGLTKVGSGGLVANAQLLAPSAIAVLAGNSAIAANIRLFSNATAVLAGSASLIPSAVLNLVGRAVLASNSAIAANILRFSPISTVLAGNAAIAANILRFINATAVLAGDSSILTAPLVVTQYQDTIHTDTIQSGLPSDWTQQFGTFTAQVVSDATQPYTDRILNTSADSVSGDITWNVVSSNADEEILTLTNITGPSVNNTAYVLGYVRYQDAIGTTNGYAAYLVSNGTSGGIVARIGSATANTLTQVGGDLSFTWSTGSWYWCRLRISGTTLSAKFWAVGSTEPSFNPSGTTSVYASGLTGHRLSTANINVGYFSAGINGAVAPGPPPQLATTVLAASSTLIANASVVKQATAVLAGNADIAANALRFGPLSTAVLAGNAAIAANILRFSQLSTVLAGNSALIASTAQFLSATAILAGSATLIANILRFSPISTVLASDSNLIVAATEKEADAATLAGSASLIASITQKFSSTAVLAGNAAFFAIAAGGGTLWQATAVLAAGGESGGNFYGILGLTRTGSGGLSASPSLFEVATVVLAASSTLVAATRLFEVARATLAGSAALVANATQKFSSTAVLAGSSTLIASATATGPTVWQVTAVLAGGDRSITANATELLTSATVLAASSTLIANLNRYSTASAILANDGKFYGFATLLGQPTAWPGSSVLAGASALLASFVQRLSANITFASNADILAQAAQRWISTALLAGDGEIIVDASIRSTQLTVNLAGTADLIASLMLVSPAVLGGGSSSSTDYYDLLTPPARKQTKRRKITKPPEAPAPSIVAPTPTTPLPPASMLAQTQPSPQPFNPFHSPVEDNALGLRDQVMAAHHAMDANDAMAALHGLMSQKPVVPQQPPAVSQPTEQKYPDRQPSLQEVHDSLDHQDALAVLKSLALL